MPCRVVLKRLTSKWQTTLPSTSVARVPVVTEQPSNLRGKGVATEVETVTMETKQERITMEMGQGNDGMEAMSGETLAVETESVAMKTQVPEVNIGMRGEGENVAAEIPEIITESTQKASGMTREATNVESEHTNSTSTAPVNVHRCIAEASENCTSTANVACVSEFEPEHVQSESMNVIYNIPVIVSVKFDVHEAFGVGGTHVTGQCTEVAAVSQGVASMMSASQSAVSDDSYACCGVSVDVAAKVGAGTKPATAEFNIGVNKDSWNETTDSQSLLDQISRLAKDYPLYKPGVEIQPSLTELTADFPTIMDHSTKRCKLDEPGQLSNQQQPWQQQQDVPEQAQLAHKILNSATPQGLLSPEPWTEDSEQGSPTTAVKRSWWGGIATGQTVAPASITAAQQPTVVHTTAAAHCESVQNPPNTSTLPAEAVFAKTVSAAPKMSGDPRGESRGDVNGGQTAIDGKAVYEGIVVALVPVELRIS